MSLANYKILDQYVLRTHLLANQEVANLNAHKIKDLCSNPVIAEAISLASPELYSEMQKLLTSGNVQNEQKLLKSIGKYLLRMGNRCTPFGLFSGCALGKFSNDDSQISFKDGFSFDRSTRLDMSYLCSLASKLEKIEGIKERLHYYPNNSIYKISDKIRYIEYRYSGLKRNYYTNSIDASIYIDAILDRCRNGARIDELISVITDEDILPSDVHYFINELIDNQVIVSSISPSVTGIDFLDVLLEEIEDLNIKNRLSAIKNLLKELDDTTNFDNTTNYSRILQLVKELERGYNRKFLFQTDLILNPEKNILNGNLKIQLRKGIEILNYLSVRKEDLKLKNFKEKFIKRYGTQRIPLAHALDVESGIGYGFKDEDEYDFSQLLKGINISYGNENSKEREKWDFKDSFLNSKLEHINGTEELLLTEQDLSLLKSNFKADLLSDSFTALVKILNGDKEPLMYFNFAGGPSASYLLGRFTNVNDEINKLVKEITFQEQSKSNAIYAEISHLPEDRVGNILFRDHLRSYEIPYISKSNLSSEFQIGLGDLWVFIENDQIKIYSKILNMEIQPRLATAHNYTYNSLPVYHFLCDLQTQNKKESLEFDWGRAGKGRFFFPRVRYKNIIVSPATWFLDRKKIEVLLRGNGYDAIEKFGFPSDIILKENDNELVIDLNNDLHFSILKDLLKKKKSVEFIEDLFNKDNSLVKRGRESFKNEFFFSFVKI